jgi:hypothetical protein
MLSLQPKVTLELDEGERILYTARRHWIVLIQRGILPMLFGLISGSLATFRVLGGTFFVSGASLSGQNDFVNYLILGIILVLMGFWLRTRSNRAIAIFTHDLPYLLVIGLFILVFVFRYSGGRIFHIDPFLIGRNDAANVWMFVIAIIMVLWSIYLVIDWANDFLILTNTRVIYDDQQLFIRHVQQQLLISDIQQVNLRQGAYVEWWLDYGTILIRSFSPRRLVFDNAAMPKAMQDKIMAEVNKIRRLSEPDALREMIEEQVYGNKNRNQPKPAIYVETRTGLIPQLFHANPEVNFDTQVIEWRPFWLFTFLMMLRPILVFLCVCVALLLLLRLDLINGSILLALWLPSFLACGGWAFWIHQEYENDRYILTRQNITDADKRPFGPETRRVAPLSAIQDISYNVGFFETILENFFGLGYGDVVIETGGAGGGRFTFFHVPDPHGVQATINDYLTDYRKHEKERQLQDSVALLKLYHEAQADHNELLTEARIKELIAQYINEQTPPAPEIQATATTREIVRNELAKAFRLRRRRRI